MVLGNSQCQCVLLINWIIVRQGPTVLAVAIAVGAGGSCLDIFLSPAILSFSLSLGDGSM